MRLPEWINDPDVPTLVKDLHWLRQRGLWGLRDNKAPMPELLAIARALTSSGHERSDHELVKKLFDVIAQDPEMLKDRRLDALKLYFGVSIESLRQTSNWRRQHTARQFFLQSYSQFRRPDVGAERDMLIRFAHFLLSRRAPSLEAPLDPVSDQAIQIGDPPGELLAFQERSYLSKALQHSLQGERSVLICPIGGGRGVGKTQLAAEYARSCRRAGWRLVAWLNAENEDQIVTGLASVAERLGRRLPGDTTTLAARRAREWLEETSDNSLLVFDNALDAELVDRWRPKTGSAQVIVTSSVLSVGNLGQALEVGVFDADEAIAYLTQQTGLDDAAGADAVARALGHLPLALSQAAWTIRKQGLTYQTFLDKLGEVPIARLLEAVPGTSYTRTTAATVILSASHAESAHDCRLAVDLLAVLAAGGCSRQLLQQCLDAATPPASWSTTHTDEAIGSLREASLITFSTDRNSVLMHRVVQRVLRERAQHDETLEEALAAAAFGLEQIQPPELNAWRERTLGSEIVDQIDAVWQSITFALQHTRTAARADNGAVPLLQTVTQILRLRVWAIRHLTLALDLERAIHIATSTVVDCDELLGPEDLLTLQARHYLANVYRNLERFTEAAAEYRQVIELRSRTLGPDHPDTLLSRNNLGLAYRRAGEAALAIAIHEEVLVARRSVLGPDHPDTLESQNNLARAYQHEGRVEEAVALLQVTVQSRASALGVQHPRTINSRHLLAGALLRLGNLDLAHDLYKQVVREREEVLGSEHPATLESRHSLAHAYLELGRTRRALDLFLSTAQLRSRVLGAEHPDTRASWSSAAQCRRALGDTDPRDES